MNFPVVGIMLLALLVVAGEIALRIRHRHSELRMSDHGLRPETKRLDPNALQHHTCVVALGDSITHGMGLPSEETYPHILGQLLRARWPGKDIMVINAGIAGQTALQGLQRLHCDVLRYRPALTLIAFGLNDAALRRRPQDIRRERDLMPAGAEAIINRLHLYRTFKTRMRKGLVALGLCEPLNYEVAPMPMPRSSPKAFRWALTELVNQITRRTGGKVVLLTMQPTYPASHIEGQDDTEAKHVHQAHVYAEYNDIVRDVARQSRSGLIDVERAFWDQEPDVQARLYERDGVHLSAEGQRFLANLVFKFIVAHGLLEDLWN